MIRTVYRLAGLFVVVGLFAADVVGSGVARAEMFLASMTPPAIVRGGTTRVVLRGEELGAALDVWTSAPGGKVRAKKIRGDDNAREAEFELSAAADAPLGLHGLRLATDDGLSNVIVFLIDDLAPQVASGQPSSNGATAGAVPLSLPASICGTFRPAAVDRYTIDVVAEAELSFECVASRLGKDADPLLRILDEHGRLLVEYDNDPGLFFDFRFAHKFAAAGRYTLELCDARYHGADDWNYVLRVGRFPADRVTLPEAGPPADADRRAYREVRRPGDDAASWVAAAESTLPTVVETEPNDAPESAVKVSLPAVLCGVLQESNDADFYEFELKKGDKLAIRAATATLDSPADVELATVGPDGKEMTRVDDVQLDEAALTLAANKDGPYRLMVRDVSRGGGPAFVYRVEVRPSGARFELVADHTDFTIPRGDFQSLPLVLTRTDYAGPVKLTLVGAPPGVTLEPNVFAEGATNLWARLRAAPDAALGIATVQIVASAEVDGATVTAIARTQPVVDREQYNVDLIKYALRENQRRLPPSVSNCVAVQVTPAAPFSVALPESNVTLVRYLSATFPIDIARRDGFAGALHFKAIGGQLGEESEIRRQVYTRFTPAEGATQQAHGTFYSRNLPQERNERVDLSTDGEVDGRRVRLVRSFDLDLRAGAKVNCGERQVTIAPGETKTLQFTVERTPPFAGPVTIEPNPIAGLNLPETIDVAADQESVDVTITVPADFAVGRQTTRVFYKAQVGEFQEEGTPLNITFDVKVPPPPKPEPKKK